LPTILNAFKNSDKLVWLDSFNFISDIPGKIKEHMVYKQTGKNYLNRK